ncbi:MAG TPA: hypothetical protein GYA07_17230 [Verrucomicrobia bacterium]|nr:hypothetical protein [Verrucomicrobiota bacterium]HOB32059.1 hypothetical protein [Verrucomicrobiota bacterium]HOP95937.1 hypothetical protein [Verrucomicrobiota bacterium]HPU54855.1 hypothetical protein [Verrucomicrobiota bacterium]
MNPDQVRQPTLRASRVELTRLAWALGVSLAVHAFCYGGYKLGEQFDLWSRLRAPAWLQKTRMLAALIEEQQRQQEPMPLVFVDVNPAVATPEPPKDAKFYSNRDSQASNPDAEQEVSVPKIDGTQTEVAKAEDVPRSPFDRLQPAVPQQTEEQPPEQPKPRTPEPIGDLALAKPDVTLRNDAGTAEEARPRTIKEALLRQNRTQLAGEKMKQEGGVARKLEFTALDAKATAFGDYDAALIEAVQARWYDRLDQLSYDGYQRGKVVIRFKLNYDGTVSDLEVVDTTVGLTLTLICEQAIRDPAPYGKWPRELRLLVEKDYREIQFGFHYN